MHSKQAIFVVLIACLSLCRTVPPRRPLTRFQRLEAAAAPSSPPAAYGPPTPAPSYGPPPPPSASYGPPQGAVTEPAVEPTTELPSLTTDANSEPIGNQTGRLQVNPSGGFYYIYHPSGALQKVSYLTSTGRNSLDVKLKYQQVEPIRGPVYTYDPQTLVLQQVVGQV
ncbi:uncharacterized protein [Euwallacea similis]|uniref:uncharacterized protein n=1 Tax=Euwallacea similis TaxID=1736056 RepID=UPI00344C2316